MEKELKFKRGANPGQGKDVEVHLLALYLLRLFLLFLNGECQHFELGFNIEGYGKFDDFVIVLTRKNKSKKTILVQIKSKLNGSVSVKLLSSIKGDFSLIQYVESGSSLKADQFILWTNAKLIGEDDNLQSTDNIEDLVDTSKSTNNHIFTYKSEKNKIFFDKFFIYTQQLSLRPLQNLIQQMFNNIGGNEESYNCFIKHCFDLYNDQPIRDIVFSEPRIDPERSGILLLVSLLKQLVVSVTPKQEEHKNMWLTFCEVANSFNIATIHSIEDEWINSDPSYQIWSKETKGSVVIKISKDNVKQVEFALKIIGQIKFYKTVIVLGVITHFPETVTVFRNLSDVNDEVSKNQLLQKFQISLELCSKVLGQEENAVLNMITPSLLFDCLRNEKLLKENLPEHYISRTINAPIIYDISVLYKKNNGMFFVVLANGYKVEDVEKEIERQKELNQKNTLSQLRKNESDITTNNFVVEKTFNFNKILQKYEQHKYIQIFRVISTAGNSLKNAKLEWIFSTGQTKNLPKPENKTLEVKLNNFYNKINLICTDPGLGKSTLLKNLYNQVPPNCYAKFIPIHKYVRVLKKLSTQKSSEEILKVLVGESLSDEKIVKNLCLIKKQLYLFFDGLDELDSQYLDNSLICIKKLLFLPHCHIWISSRLHLKERLENEFEVRSMTIDNISKEQQKTYIKGRLGSDFSDMDLILNNIYSNFDMFVQNTDFLGIPLYLFVVTEVLNNNDEENVINELLILTILYEIFLQGKLNHLQHKNIKNYRNINNVYNLEQYEIVALKLCLDKTDFELLNINNYENYVSSVKTSLNAGIITDFSEDNIAVFDHYSFAEYFCARFFCREFNRFQNQLKKIFFIPKYKSIRIFINMKLSENSPLHLDVVYLRLNLNNLDQNNVKNCKDSGGRNLLQTAISCGEYYELSKLATFQTNTTYYNILDNININYKLLEIIKGLHNFFDLKEKDLMLSISSINYVKKIQDLSIINIFLSKFNYTLKNYCLNHKQAILGYSAMYGFINLLNISFYDLHLLNTVKFYYNTKYGQWDGFAIHIISYQGNINCLKTLIQKRAHINIKDDSGFTPLFITAQNGHLHCLKALIKNGADINSKNIKGFTPLYVAAEMGQLECLQTLIESGADIHSRSDEGFFPLYGAVQHGQLDCLNILIQNGADVNLKTDKGFFPLNIAALHGQLDCLKSLIQNGADINYKNDKSFPLYGAALRGHFDCIQFLIENGVNVNTQSYRGFFPIHGAVQNNHLKCLEILIENGADVNSKNNDGFFPLCVAAEKNHLECLEILIKHGADVNAMDNDGLTSLYMAAKNNHVDCLKILIKNGANVNAKGYSPLQIAALNGQLESLLILIENGADVNSSNKDGFSPLYLASYNNHLECLQALIQNGASINSKSDEGFSPLHVATCKGHSKCLQKLIKNGADLNIKDPEGLTSLYMAASYGQLECLQILIENGADVNFQNNEGLFPLCIAAENDHMECLKTLIENGAIVNLQDTEGITSLYSAAKHGRLNCLQILIDNGADVNSKKNNGVSSIYISAQNGHLECLEALIEKGADVNSKSDEGFFPLYGAALHGHLQCLQILIKHGADVNAKKNNGVSSVYIAAQNNHLECLRILIQNGAEVNAKNDDGFFPLYVAALNGHLKCLEILIENGADVNMKSNEGFFSLYIATQMGQLECLKFLIKNGANVNAKTDEGFSSLDIAQENSYFECALVLKMNGAKS